MSRPTDEVDLATAHPKGIRHGHQDGFGCRAIDRTCRHRHDEAPLVAVTVGTAYARP